jgi:hypothetical protein
VPVDDKGPVFDKDPGSESVFKQRSHSPETYPRQGISSSPKEHQSKTGHLLKNGMSNFMKKVHGTPQPEIQQGYDEMNSDIHQMRLSFEDTDHRDENTTDSGVSPMKASASNLMGHLTMIHSMHLLQILITISPPLELLWLTNCLLSLDQ